MGVRKISFWFLFWSFFSMNLFGQSVVTLDDCINWAVSISSENLQKNLNEELLKVKLHDVSSHIFPHLELLGSLNYYSHVPQLPSQLGYAPLSKDQYAASLEFSQMLYDGNQFYYNRQYERMMNRNELHKLDLSLNRIKDQVIDIYLNLLIINKKIDLLAIIDASIKEQFENAKVLLKEGVIYGNMVSQLELEILKLQQQTEELYAIRSSLIHSLCLLTGHSLTESTFQTPEFPVLQRDLPSQRLELAIFETTLKGLDYQKNFLCPRVCLILLFMHQEVMVVPLMICLITNSNGIIM
ncbi:MAG TPA: TolC family protein [Bacteroidales bacterium]|nr:TolC family protein [Bacteroidales bacterium]